MLQSPYFFFDVVYLHNGVEEQGDETSWRVSAAAGDGGLLVLCAAAPCTRFDALLPSDVP